jgi:pimeloyl-ACP methyl ester carboxylesterase
MILLLLFSLFLHAQSFDTIYTIHSHGLDPSQGSNISTILFLGGFPDTSQTWSLLAPAFNDQYHVLTMALPDYEADDLKSFWGYSIQQMVDDLARIAQWYKDQGSKAVYLVGHDWGAHICLCLIDVYYNRKVVDKAILLDVGLRSQRDILTDIISLSYMSYLASAFLISRLSNFLATWIIRLYPWNWIGPCRHHSDIEYAANKIFFHTKGFMTYPYFHLLFSKMPQFRPDIPQLFLYGTEKATMFHSSEYLHLLEKTPSCDYQSLDGCGHWCHWPRKIMSTTSCHSEMLTVIYFIEE